MTLERFVEDLMKEADLYINEDYNEIDSYAGDMASAFVHARTPDGTHYAIAGIERLNQFEYRIQLADCGENTRKNGRVAVVESALPYER